MNIITYPSEILKRHCVNVESFGDSLRKFADDMTTEMYASNGVGLAAPQVGSMFRIVIIDQSAGEIGNELLTLVNPTMIWSSPELDLVEERCLSLPDVFVNVKRSVACDVEYLDLSGELKRERFTNFKARITQHEIDHLNGTLMIGRIGPLARDLALKNLVQIKQVKP